MQQASPPAAPPAKLPSSPLLRSLEVRADAFGRALRALLALGGAATPVPGVLSAGQAAPPPPAAVVGPAAALVASVARLCVAAAAAQERLGGAGAPEVADAAPHITGPPKFGAEWDWGEVLHLCCSQLAAAAAALSSLSSAAVGAAPLLPDASPHTSSARDASAAAAVAAAGISELILEVLKQGLSAPASGGGYSELGSALVSSPITSSPPMFGALRRRKAKNSAA